MMKDFKRIEENMTANIILDIKSQEQFSACMLKMKKFYGSSVIFAPGAICNILFNFWRVLFVEMLISCRYSKYFYF